MCLVAKAWMKASGRRLGRTFLSFGRTSLSEALQISRLLLSQSEAQYLPDPTDPRGRSVLHHLMDPSPHFIAEDLALEEFYLEATMEFIQRLLRETGFNVDRARDAFGDTVLHSYTTLMGATYAYELLGLPGINAKTKSGSGRNIWFAAMGFDPPELPLLRNMLKRIEDLRVDPNQPDHKGVTPMLHAVAYSPRSKTITDWRYYIQVFEMYLEFGCNPSLRDNTGLSAALHADQFLRKAYERALVEAPQRPRYGLTEEYILRGRGNDLLTKLATKYNYLGGRTRHIVMPELLGPK